MIGKHFQKPKTALMVLLVSTMLGASVILAGSFFSSTTPQSVEEFKRNVFNDLRDIRIRKKTEALAFLQHQLEVVTTAKNDPRYTNAFSAMLSLFMSNQYGTARFSELDRKWERMYVNEFRNFYDILLLDLNGTIFYTVRMERDFLSNIDSQLFQGLGIKEGMKNLGEEIKFIDYEIYAASEEPASFFLVPLFVESKKIGTMVFQLPLNEINRILKDYSGPKKTEEVYLVNRKRLMLTESRFLRDNIILRKKIETKAILNAMGEDEGEDIITDYRGKRVFSSYEQFEFEGTAWTIIAEIDEEEVITDLYKSWHPKIFDRLLQMIDGSTVVSTIAHPVISSKTKKSKRSRVDLKEYRSAEEKTELYTIGVATCTAISIHIPNKLGYLLHISPTDEIYGISGSQRRLLGRDYTNMIDEVIGKILWFDIRQHERGLLRFGVFATQAESLRNAVEKLLKKEMFLAQIKLLYKPSYRSVSVELDFTEDGIRSFWESEGGLHNGALDLAKVPNLETVFKRAIGY